MYHHHTHYQNKENSNSCNKDNHNKDNCNSCNKDNHHDNNADPIGILNNFLNGNLTAINNYYYDNKLYITVAVNSLQLEFENDIISSYIKQSGATTLYILTFDLDTNKFVSVTNIVEFNSIIILGGDNASKIPLFELKINENGNIFGVLTTSNSYKLNNGVDINKLFTPNRFTTMNILDFGDINYCNNFLIRRYFLLETASFISSPLRFDLVGDTVYFIGNFGRLLTGRSEGKNYVFAESSDLFRSAIFVGYWNTRINKIVVKTGKTTKVGGASGSQILAIKNCHNKYDIVITGTFIRNFDFMGQTIIDTSNPDISPNVNGGRSSLFIFFLDESLTIIKSDLFVRADVNSILESAIGSMSILLNNGDIYLAGLFFGEYNFGNIKLESKLTSASTFLTKITENCNFEFANSISNNYQRKFTNITNMVYLTGINNNVLLGCHYWLLADFGDEKLKGEGGSDLYLATSSPEGNWLSINKIYNNYPVSLNFLLTSDNKNTAYYFSNRELNVNNRSLSLYKK